MELIEIREGMVELKEVSTVRRVKLDEFKKTLLESAGMRTPILPKGVVFYASKGSKKIYLIEREPALIKILYAADREHGKEYALPFPYHYFLLTFQNYAFEKCFFYFRNKAITKVEDMFLIPPLPNLYSPDCSVCLGDFKYEISAETLEKICGVTKYFFESTFNNDLNEFMRQKAPKQITSLKRSREEHCFDAWQRFGFDEISSVEWFNCRSLAESIESVFGKED